MDLRMSNQHTYHIYMHIGFPKKLNNVFFVLKVRKLFFSANDYKKRWIQNIVIKQILILFQMSLLGRERKNFVYFYEAITLDTIMNDYFFLFGTSSGWYDLHRAEITMRSTTDSPLINGAQPIIFILNVNEWKTYGKKLTHRWLKAYGWMPKEDHLHVLYSKTLASRAFPPAVMHGGWRPSTGGTSSWNTSMEDTCVIQYCQEWLKATVQSLLWTRTGGKGDRRVALDLWGLPFSCSISA